VKFQKGTNKLQAWFTFWSFRFCRPVRVFGWRGCGFGNLHLPNAPGSERAMLDRSEGLHSILRGERLTIAVLVNPTRWMTAGCWSIGALRITCWSYCSRDLRRFIRRTTSATRGSPWWSMGRRGEMYLPPLVRFVFHVWPWLPPSSNPLWRSVFI